jgi:hypothetical protein
MAKERKMQVRVDGSVLVFAFEDGLGPERFDSDILNADMQYRARLHGLEQKLRDVGAGKDNTASDCRALAQKVWAGILAGQWRGVREAGEPREEPIDLLAAALFTVAQTAGFPGASLEKARTQLELMDKAGRRAVRSLPAVAKALIDLRAAKATAPTIDLQALFA